jgi:hypothetical protein
MKNTMKTSMNTMMNTMKNTSLSVLLVAPTLCALSAGCSASLFSSAAAFCARADECSDDSEEDNDSDEGQDDVAVCSETQVGLINGLRANTEPECDALAAAIEALQACQAGLDCDDFNADDDNGQCDDQRTGLSDACDDIVDGEIDCESFLQLNCGFGA